eukprot:CAMPEP_0201594764 /NCGR_PEP_ID=MMETSP0190_2-20130828/191973_1 /ASSEMBLY_ACC=CAM_ASM_000263 /TAXON_ID=37353 /ORGANISM="Rosalina sp." /LENGTH=216 /DNA_ID=CAMNT_0048054487 /DNA_START=622 /DNA_END=1272 /DNA_ORIENTATION=-
MRKVRNLDLNAHKIDSNSIQSASTTPTVNKMAQFVVDPVYFDDDILEEKDEQETELERKKRISKKIMNITITSPDNQHTIVMKNEKLKREGSASPTSPKALRKKYGLDLNFNRTTTLKRMQQEREKVRSDEENDTDAYDTDDDGNGSPLPGSGNGSRPNSTKYADGSVAAILASIEQDEAEMSENEDEVGDLVNMKKQSSLKSRTKRMSQSLSTAL